MTEYSSPTVCLGNDSIAFVTVLFNCEKYMSLFFACMSQQTDKDFVVIVIDNASKDGSLAQARALAQAHRVQCEFIANEGNLGIAVGNNQGIERARELGLQHIVLINNDIGCENDLVSRIRLRAIVAGHKAWTCLAYYGESTVRWYGGGKLSYWLARGIHFGQKQSETICHPVAVTYAPTCLMYLHASVFERVGLMDPQYFVYYDDTDFCKRIEESGIVLMYDPEVSFRHYVGGSSGGDLSFFFLRMSTRNKFIYIQKHYEAPGREIVMVMALMSKLIQLTLSSRRSATLAGLRAYFSSTTK